MKPNNNPELEEVLLAKVVMKDKYPIITITPDCDLYQLYGILKCYIKKLEELLAEDFEPTDGDEDG